MGNNFNMDKGLLHSLCFCIEYTRLESKQVSNVNLRDEPSSFKYSRGEKTCPQLFGQNMGQYHEINQ